LLHKGQYKNQSTAGQDKLYNYTPLALQRISGYTAASNKGNNYITKAGAKTELLASVGQNCATYVRRQHSNTFNANIISYLLLRVTVKVFNKLVGN